jgi:O-antigen ligase
VRAERQGGGVLHTCHAVLVAAIVAWGAFAFGAVYPWAYAPLAAAALIAGAIGLFAGRSQRVPRIVPAALAAAALAIGLQLVPLPPAALRAISPSTPDVLARYQLIGPSSSGVHALSIDPMRTLLGLGLAASLALFWLGLTAMARSRAVLGWARAVIGIGAVLALVGIVAPSGHGARIYGVWEPQSVATSFGPFVNRNHFAGWMLMAIPLGTGYLLSLLEREMSPRSWRERLLWLSTASASGTILTAGALAAMSLSVLMSLSRSGIVCLAASVMMLLIATARLLARTRGRAVVLAVLVAIALGAVGWAGLDRLDDRFAEFHRDGSAGRSQVWSDARRVTRAFPIAGTGFNTFGVAMLFYQTGDLAQWYAEAHSDYLQIVAEGGLLVAVPFAAALAAAAFEMFRRLRDPGSDPRTYWLRVGAIVGLLTIAVQETVEFSLQMPGNAALCAVLAAIALHRSDRRVARSLELSSAAQVRGAAHSPAA